MGHNYDTSWAIDVQPTCTEAGSKSHHCKRTGCDSKKDVTPVAALGHVDLDRDGNCDRPCGTYLATEKTEVVITIDDKFIYYGENDVTLTYTMTPATVDEELDIVITRKPGNGIGEYEIDIEWNHNAYFNLTKYTGTYYIADPGLNYRYDEEKGGYFVTGYEGEETKVIIENKYDDGENGLKAVIGIDKAAFKDNTTITEVSIAESVEFIGNVAFSGCTAITKIDFKDVNGWYCLKASDAGAQENWMEKESGTIFALGNETENAKTLVNSEEKVDYYWYKGITLAP